MSGSEGEKDMRKITIEEIKQILGTREERVRELWRRSRKLYEELENNEELIKSVSLPSANSLYENQLSEKNRDLFDVIVKQKRLGHQQEQEIGQLLWEFTSEIESINRIWICYQMLRGMPYRIITRLYVERELYRVVEAESKLNHRAFETMRKKALESIKENYEREETNMELIGEDIMKIT